MWTREQLVLLARSNPEALVDIILTLEARLAHNSNNSSKPPGRTATPSPLPRACVKRAVAHAAGKAAIQAAPCNLRISPI